MSALGRENGALALLAATQFLLILDAAIVGVAMPPIADELGLTPAQLSWVPNAYTLLFGGFLLLGGRLGDVLGRRRLFVAGVVVFTLASLFGALATSGLWLVAARGVQGLAAAFVSPTALALILATFVDGRARARALGIWASVGATGGAAGFIAGGILVTALGWRSVLYVNVPIGLAVAWLAPRLLPRDSAGNEREGLDLAGAATVTGGLALLIFALVDGGADGWSSPQTLALIGASILLLAIFVAVEHRARHPLVPLAIFRRAGFSAAVLVAGLSTAAVFPMFFFLNLYTQQVLGYTPLEAGLAQLPLSLLITASAMLGPRVIGRLGTRAGLVGGLAATTIGLVWLSRWTIDADYLSAILLPALVIGPGAGIVWVATSVAATAGAKSRESGLYSGVLTASQQLGGAVGLAALTAVATAGSAVGVGAPAAPELAAGLGAGLVGAAAVTALAAVVALMRLAASPSPDPQGARRAVAVPADDG